MAQQDTDQRHAAGLPVDDEGFVDDTEDCEEREHAHRERGTVRPITVVGNPVLHKECQDVTEFDDELASLIDDMFASQRAAEGVGLAANQIGVDLKVFVYDCPDDEGVRHVGVVCNPVLDELPAERRSLDDTNEGCLSVPDRLRAARPPRLRRGARPGREGQADQGRAAPATSPAASSTRRTTCTATSTSTGSPSGSARTP